MQPHEAAHHIGISVNTLRAWTLYDFKEFVSPSAQGGSGRQRDVTDTDLRVLGYINSLKRDGLSKDEVLASLRQARERGFDVLPLPQNNEAIVPTRVIPLQAAEAAVRGKQDELDLYRERLQELRDLVEYERQRANQERERLDLSTDKIAELNHKIGGLETKVEMLEQQLKRGG